MKELEQNAKKGDWKGLGDGSRKANGGPRGTSQGDLRDLEGPRGGKRHYVELLGIGGTG